MIEFVYLDADVCDERLAAALGRSGMRTAWGTREAPPGADDESQLVRAVELGAVMVTANFVDFARLHTTWSARGQAHLGIVTVRRIPPRSPEAIAGVLIDLMAQQSSESMANSFHRV